MLLLVVSYFCQTMRILYFFPPQKSSSPKLAGSPESSIEDPEVMPLMAGFFGIGVTVRSITRAGTRKPVFNVAG